MPFGARDWRIAGAVALVSPLFYAVARVLREALVAMELDWPPADFDVEEQKRRLAKTWFGL